MALDLVTGEQLALIDEPFPKLAILVLSTSGLQVLVASSELFPQGASFSLSLACAVNPNVMLGSLRKQDHQSNYRNETHLKGR